MVKSVEKAVKEVVEGKGYDVTLHMRDGKDLAFKDVAGWQLSSEWVAVMTKDGGTYAYRASTVDSASHTVSE